MPPTNAPDGRVQAAHQGLVLVAHRAPLVVEPSAHEATKSAWVPNAQFLGRVFTGLIICGRPDPEDHTLSGGLKLRAYLRNH